jgi:tetratricopeptide (TPR) repeat protein
METSLEHATALHQAGRRPEAERLYRQILAGDPNNADALHLLGVLAHQAGHPQAAEPLVRRALATAPGAFAYHNSLGNVLRALGRAAEAEAAYRQALRLRADVPDFHHHLGLALKDQGRMADAEAAFRQAIRLNHGFVRARTDLATLLIGAARHAEAETCALAARMIAPRDPGVLNALGMALAAQGKNEAALDAFDQMLDASPGNPSALANRAHSLAGLERHAQAVAAYQAALAATPDAQDLRQGLARALIALQRGPEAETCLRAELAARPDNAHSWTLLAGALGLQDRTEEALACFVRASRLAPSVAENFQGIGLALRDLARWPDSLPYFAEAVRLAPDNAEYHANYAYALLANGKFAQAWPQLEWRARKPGNVMLRVPAWDGAAFDGTVMIHAEQGIGDTIQFARFLPEAARRARIIVGCNQALSALLRDLPGVAEVFTGDPVPPYDVHRPIMSLPGVLGIGPERFADPVPYVHADPAQVAVWRGRLAHLGGMKVGLAWAGNPKYALDRKRSVPPALLAPLLAVRSASFVSLQMGEGRAVMPEGVALDAAPWLEDLTDTAAAIAALDLVISVDTSVAHLAGALGQKVWLLNRANTDWRWLTDRDDSPWYPSMRIFRQPRPGAWHEMIAAVGVALGEEKEAVLF